MKVAFVGKGGSGKTTLSALYCRYLASLDLPVVAIDADINQHLGAALGADEDQLDATPAMGSHITELKELLRGDNPRIASAEEMVKTTPPGAGSTLVPFPGDNPVHNRFGYDVDGITLMRTGPFSEDDLGVACYHSKVGAVELYLNHLVDSADGHVVVDMTAGADAFASGLFTRFDVTFLVAEPTLRGVSVFEQYAEYARDHEVTIHVVGNKVHTAEDMEFLREHVGDALAVCVGPSDYVRALEKGRRPAFETLEDENLKALAWMRDVVDATPQDWPRFTRQAVEFHLRNARKWANAATGTDLTQQVDPTFVMGPESR
ncbi:ATP-binding protein [Lipingzhangella sp. LS1_29]|uniref:ATP-binding protein n=1 Tax=Lipingzhangella rawalii TaxID=2055835 RepID=A0ABU2HB55_9ACTN|nr:ATP-binding protein [Lipingzhangella rawalii]MDS1272493.1 ATP-binding protein [Lipingzhangella rawalii]